MWMELLLLPAMSELTLHSTLTAIEVVSDVLMLVPLITGDGLVVRLVGSASEVL